MIWELGLYEYARYYAGEEIECRCTLWFYRPEGGVHTDPAIYKFQFITWLGYIKRDAQRVNRWDKKCQRVNIWI